MFERIDKEEDGEVYLREVVDFLKVLDNDIEQSNQVKRIWFYHFTKGNCKVNMMLMEYKTQNDRVLNFEEFTVSLLLDNCMKIDF